MKVLMVDDDEDDFVIVRDLLRDAGDGRYDLNWVSSYEAGVRGACGSVHRGGAEAWS